MGLETNRKMACLYHFKKISFQGFLLCVVFFPLSLSVGCPISLSCLCSVFKKSHVCVCERERGVGRVREREESKKERED